MALSLNDVNRKYTFTWIKCNDDAKSPYFRKLFIKNNKICQYIILKVYNFFVINYNIKKMINIIN